MMKLCKIDGCGGCITYRERCLKHYRRWLANAQVDDLRPDCCVDAGKTTVCEAHRPVVCVCRVPIEHPTVWEQCGRCSRPWRSRTRDIEMQGARNLWRLWLGSEGVLHYLYLTEAP